MNAETFKSDLQQVFDSDIALRKEFNDLKRSLSDYRNQLIHRDEDCKKLQVTIDVLNTKLAVIERDNLNYKNEIAAFKELRTSIKEQLHEKQAEIELRLEEISGLKNELSSIANEYEEKIELIKEQSASEIESIKTEYTGILNELRNTAHYKEIGLKEEYENRLNELSASWADKEESLQLLHQEEINNIKNAWQEELTFLRNDYNSQISRLNSERSSEVESLSVSHEKEIAYLTQQNSRSISNLEDAYTQKIEALEYTYRNEIASLKLELEEQRNKLTNELRNHLDYLTQDYSNREQKLVSDYEGQIAELKSSSVISSESLSSTYESQINAIKASHEELINELKSGYEEKLSNTLIHSNAQNTKLNDEISRLTSEFESSQTVISDLTKTNNEQSSHIDVLTSQLAATESKLNEISLEFDNFKQTSALSAGEQVNELNTQIENLNNELINLGQLLEQTTNSLGLAEGTIEEKTLEIEASQETIRSLNEQLNVLQAAISEKELSFENEKNELHASYLEKEASLESYKTDLEANFRTKESDLENFRNELLNSTSSEIAGRVQEYENQIIQLQSQLTSKEEEFGVLKNELETNFIQKLDVQETEFNKLLAENSNLINEIDLAQDKVEAQEAEIAQLKALLDEMSVTYNSRAEELKDVINSRNFELSNLQGNNAALNQEILSLKAEIEQLTGELQNSAQSNEQFTALQHNYDSLYNEKNNLISEINTLQSTISGLNECINDLNSKISAFESEVHEVENQGNSADQEEFIDRLFKQIDVLNDEKMGLLNEKEAMAEQLLKMSEVIGELSQQVDAQNIDVTSLNNHRKNVILASNSSAGPDERSQMKKQINDLVREIDKCIALLSA